MVLINGVKYACERCIRGHRVTTCNHTDQPLMMIKPKGRPSTTCDHCKELRKNKNANPSGVCTCGRLEKKRLAQKVKEETRAKAREEKRLKDCKCLNDDACRCHSARRSVRKKNSVSGSLKKENNDDHLMSPISMDSKNNNMSETSLRDQDFNGKVSKDYHHVPSLHSISSFHSTQSLDNNFTIPQSPPMSGTHYGFNVGSGNVSGQPSHGVANGSHLNHSSSFVNWDNSSIASSETNFNLQSQTDRNVSVGLDPLQNTKKISPMTRTRVGEVTIPLEEYIPSSIDGVGKINDTNSLTQDWSFDKNFNDSNLSSGPANTSTITNNTSTNSGLLDMFLDSSSIPALSRANLLLQEKNSDPNANANSKTEVTADSDIKDNNNSNNNSNLPNGFKKTYSFQSPQDALYHYNIKDKYNNNTSVIPKSNSNSNFNSNSNNKGSSWVNSTGVDESEDASVDNESIRSVEVLSLTPSFMDIPERSSNSHINHHQPQQSTQRHSSGSQRSKQRSASIHRNHRYPSSSYLGQSAYNIRSQPITINPSMVSTVDDNTSLSSLQSPTSSVIDGGFINSSTDFQSSKQLPDRIKSPRSSILMDNTIQFQHPRQQNQVHQPPRPYALQPQQSQQSLQSQQSQLLDDPAQEQTSQLLSNLGISLDSDQFLGLSTTNENNYENSLKSNIKEIGAPMAFSNTMLKADASPASSNQTASPPSQLLTEKSFADLDNFMSIL